MLTKDEIIQLIDQELNAGRGEPMFNEVQFSLDLEAGTILSLDEDSNEWLVNRITVRGDSVEVEPIPMMSFPAESL